MNRSHMQDDKESFVSDTTMQTLDSLKQRLDQIGVRL
jgi:hypothetical protein